jgi:hypothetical protein
VDNREAVTVVTFAPERMQAGAYLVLFFVRFVFLRFEAARAVTS